MVRGQLHGMHSGGGSPFSKNSRVRRECPIRLLLKTDNNGLTMGAISWSLLSSASSHVFCHTAVMYLWMLGLKSEGGGETFRDGWQQWQICLPECSQGLTSVPPPPPPRYFTGVGAKDPGRASYLWSGHTQVVRRGTGPGPQSLLCPTPDITDPLTPPVSPPTHPPTWTHPGQILVWPGQLTYLNFPRCFTTISCLINWYILISDLTSRLLSCLGSPSICSHCRCSEGVRPCVYVQGCDSPLARIYVYDHPTPYLIAHSHYHQCIPPGRTSPELMSRHRTTHLQDPALHGCHVALLRLQSSTMINIWLQPWTLLFFKPKHT